MANILTLDAFNVEGKTVLVRVDFNSPVDPETQKILDDVRIRTHGTTTIAELAQKGAKVVILAHQGRPGEADISFRWSNIQGFWQRFSTNLSNMSTISMVTQQNRP